MNITLFAGNPDSNEQQMKSEETSSASSSPFVRDGSPTVSEPSEQRTIKLNTHETCLPEGSLADMNGENNGPAFKQLSLHDRQLIVKADKNLGHPANDRLAMLLKQQGASPEVIEGVHAFRCSVCSMQSPPKHSRPATIKEELDFNDRVAIDGLKFVYKFSGSKFSLVPLCRFRNQLSCRHNSPEQIS